DARHPGLDGGRARVVVRRGRRAAVPGAPDPGLGTPPGRSPVRRHGEPAQDAARAARGGLHHRSPRSRDRLGGRGRHAEAAVPAAAGARARRARGGDRERSHPAGRPCGWRTRPPHPVHLEPGGLRDGLWLLRHGPDGPGPEPPGGRDRRPGPRRPGARGSRSPHQHRADGHGRAARELRPRGRRAGDPHRRMGLRHLAAPDHRLDRRPGAADPALHRGDPRHARGVAARAHGSPARAPGAHQPALSAGDPDGGLPCRPAGTPATHHLRVRAARRRERRRQRRPRARPPAAWAARQAEPHSVQRLPGCRLLAQPAAARASLSGHSPPARHRGHHPGEPRRGHPGGVRPARRRPTCGLTAGGAADMAGIGVVVNPHARANRSGTDAREERMRDILGAFGWVRVTSTLDDVDEVAREFHDRRVDVLAICGGDGSDHCTLTSFYRQYGSDALPLLLPLRAGTINYVADAPRGRPGTPEQVLSRVVRDYRRGSTHVTTERDLLRVNGSEIGFLLSFGTAVNYLRAYYALDRQGPWPAAKLLGRLIASALAGTHISRAVFQAVEADIDCDGEPLPFRLFTFFFAGTIEQIALGFQPTYLATRKRGYFHVLGGPIPARRLIRRAVRIYRGFPTGEPLLYDSIGKKLSIRFARPTHLMLDGDILDPAGRLEIDVPRRVALIRG